MTKPELITRSKEPLNLEMPFSTLEDWITPNDRFYIRCHFPVPEVEAASFRLQIAGEVERELAFSLEELRALPQHTVIATMECAGNGRSHLEPKVKGVQWDIGAVGNARWTGVLLRDVLEKAGVKPGAVEVILEGADRGNVAEPPRPPTDFHYTRSLPLAKAMGDTLLALEMNGEPLTPPHGFPLRAVVPGWFGMASVKWLRRLVVTARPFHGYFQTFDYAYWERRGDHPDLTPLSEIAVKAQIAQPKFGEVVDAGSSYTVRGAAWSGESPVTQGGVQQRWRAKLDRWRN